MGKKRLDEKEMIDRMMENGGGYTMTQEESDIASGKKEISKLVIDDKRHEHNVMPEKSVEEANKTIRLLEEYNIDYIQRFGHVENEDSCVAFFPKEKMNPEKEIKIIKGYENIRDYVQKYSKNTSKSSG